MKTKKTVIEAKGLSKTFRIPHENISTLRGAFVNGWKRKTYEEFEALDDVSFSIREGEFFGIIGRNGSGKSTLLKILAGIYTPDSGSVKIDGRVSPFLELGIGFNPELSGRNNIYLNATVLGLSKKQIDEKFDSIVDFSELERFIDQKMKNYSSGMQTRLAFSVAIHANREILLMDEVLAVGDTNFQQKCIDEFIRYRELGKTVVLVSHDIDTIQKYCDRVLLLREGAVQKIGKPSDVYELYIQQNMNDAELQALKEESQNTKANEHRPEETRKGKNPRITAVDIMDSTGESKHIIQTDDQAVFHIEFDRQQYPKNETLHIGIGVYKDDGSYVFGYNTQMDKQTISPEKNSVDLVFEKFPLLRGRYTVNVVCFGTEESQFFDFQKEVVSFQVFPTVNTNRYRGSVVIPHEWKI